MKFISSIILAISLCSLSCQKKKSNQNEIATSPALTSVLLQKSIDSLVSVDDRRLDIKMKRKFYEPKKGDLVTYQKYFDKGDTTKLIKLREEILYGDFKMEVIQYHFIKSKLVEIHDYEYNKKCGENEKQCMTERKFYFGKNEAFLSGFIRKAEGTSKDLPNIENANFQDYSPSEEVLQSKINRIERINQKYATLPYPKIKL